MSWKVIHRWLGLTVGTLAVVLGITGSVLAIDPVQQAWQAPVAPGDLPVAMLVAARWVVPDLSWPGLLTGLVLVLKVYWLGFWIQSRGPRANC